MDETLRDARTIYANHPDTPEKIEAFWQREADRGFAERGLRTGLVETGDTISSYVNHGRWVADCPYCNGGIACWPDYPRGCCLDCGHIYKIRFPSKRDRERAEQILLERLPLNRNWHPHQGETLLELKAENSILLADEET